MTIVVIYMAISLIFDTFSSCYRLFTVTDPSIFSTIYTVIGLVIIANYFENDKKLIYITITLGIIFDIVYTNTMLLNVIIFLVIIFILKEIDNYIPNNLFTINIKAFLGIVIYHTLSYVILLLLHYGNYPVRMLGMIIVRSIIMSLLYASTSYLLFKKIYYFKYDRKIK